MPRKKTTNGTNGASRSSTPRDPESIARRAYELYLNRGGTHGADLDDWLEAERQLEGGAPAVSRPAAAKPRRRKPAGETGL